MGVWSSFPPPGTTMSYPPPDTCGFCGADLDDGRETVTNEFGTTSWCGRCAQVLPSYGPYKARRADASIYFPRIGQRVDDPRMGAA